MIKAEQARIFSDIEKAKIDEKKERHALVLVEELIDLAISDGKYLINWYNTLPKNAVNQLVENGYRVSFHNRFDYYYQISWEKDCKAEYIETGSNKTHTSWCKKMYRFLLSN